MEYDNSFQSTDSIISPQFGMGVLTPLTDTNEDMKEDIQTENENENPIESEQNDMENNEIENNEMENKSDEMDTEMESKTRDSYSSNQLVKDSDNDSSETDDEDSDDDDDEYGGKKLLNMTQAHLMQVRNSKKGPSPKQLNRFIKGIKKKKQEGGDRFCIIDLDTIEAWSKLEVAYWIISIGFEQYAFEFYALPIDGDMLIRDMNKESIIEDLGVMKIHSNRILRQIDKLRKVVNEGFDQDVIDGMHIEPDLERPTMAIIESLQERIEKLTDERDDIMKELESKNDNDDEEGYFTKKIQDLENERDILKQEIDQYVQQMEEIKGGHNEEMDGLNNVINELNVTIDEIKKELKVMKKKVRKAERAGLDEVEDDEDDDDDDDDEEEEVKEEEDLEEVEITHTRDEIEAQIRTEMEDNNTFGLEEKVLEWSPAEVCQWLENIQFGPYVEVFYSTQIFGDVLIQDIGTRMLKKCKVTSMHIPKLLRQIGGLRKAVMEKGVRIQLSEEIKKEMFPEQYKKLSEDKKSKKVSRVLTMKRLLTLLLSISSILMMTESFDDACDELESCSECALREDCGWCNDECWDLSRREECLLQHEKDIIDETPGCNDNDPITLIGFDQNEQLEYEMHIITCETVEEEDKTDTNCDEQIIVTTLWIKTADIDTLTFDLFAKVDEISTIGNDDEEEEEYIERSKTETWPPCYIHIRYGYVSSISCPDIQSIMQQQEEEDNTLTNATPRRRNMDEDEEIDAFYTNNNDNNNDKRKLIDDDDDDDEEFDNNVDDTHDFSDLENAMNETKNISIVRVMREIFLNQFRELLPRVDSTLYDSNTADVSEKDPNGRVVYKRRAYLYNKTDVHGNNKSKVILTKSNNLDDYEEWHHSIQPTDLQTDEIQEIDEDSKHIKKVSFTERVSLESSRSSDVYDVENTKIPPSSYNDIAMDIELLQVDIVSNDYMAYLQELYDYSLQEYKYETRYYTLGEWRAARSSDDENSEYGEDFEFNSENTDLDYGNVDEFFENERESRRRRLNEGSSKYVITDRFNLIGPYEYTLVNTNIFGINFKSVLTLEAGVGIDWDNKNDIPGWHQSILVKKYTQNDKCPFDLLDEVDGLKNHYKIDDIHKCCNKWKYNYGMCYKSKSTSDSDLRNCVNQYTSTKIADEVKKWADGEWWAYVKSKWKFCELDWPEANVEDALSPFFATVAADLRINNNPVISFGVSYNYISDTSNDEKSAGWPPICIPVAWGISVCFTIELYFNFGLNPDFGTNGNDIYFGVSPFAAAGAGAYGYIDAIILRAGVFVRGDLIRIELPGRVTFVNQLWDGEEKDAHNYPKYSKYSIDFKYTTAVITAGLYWQHRYLDCGCKCSWSGCSCWCGFKWSGRKTIYSIRFVLGGSSSTNIYSHHDGTQVGDLVKHVEIKAKVYSLYKIDSNSATDSSDFYKLLNILNVNSGEYDDNAYQFLLNFEYDKNNITINNTRRRLLTLPYPGYDYVSQLNVDLVVFNTNEASHILDSISNGALSEMDILSDSMIDIETNSQSSETWIPPTPKPTKNPTPSPTDEGFSTIEVQCDNELQMYYSNDGVTNFELILEGKSEMKYLKRLVAKPCDESKLLFKCSYNSTRDTFIDNGEGGFIANIEFNNFNYPTNIYKYANYFEILNTSGTLSSNDTNNTDIELIQVESILSKEHNISNNESKWIWIDDEFIINNDETLTTIFFEFSYRVTDADPCPLQDCEEFDWIKRDINWNKIGSNFPQINYNLDVDTKYGSLSISTEMDYIGYTSAGYYKTEYGFGATYVLDFESYNGEYSSINEPGTCSNRVAESFTNRGFEEWWKYSHSPYGKGHLGSSKYLAYGPTGKYWDISSSNEYNEFSSIGCNKFKYFATFTWGDLLQCRNYHQNISYIQISNDDSWINMSGTFYVNLVSPVSKEFNLKTYRVYQLISVPFIIAVRKIVNLLASNGVALFQMTFISIYKEEKANKLRMILLTQSAQYLMLDDIYLYAYPNILYNDTVPYNLSFYLPDSELENGTIESIECINAQNGVCLQLWEIQLDNIRCPTILTGDYVFSFTTLCNPDSNNNNDKEYCETWKEKNPNYDIIEMDTYMTWDDEICEKKEFYIHFGGEMQFYLDEDYLIQNPQNGLYLINKDRIYVQVTGTFPSDTISFYNIELNNVWLCSTNYLDELSIQSQSNITNSGCFSPNIDNDNGYAPYYIISNGKQTNNSLTKEIIHIAGGENKVRFSFIVPDTITRDKIYVHVQLQIVISKMTPPATTATTATQRRLLNIKTSTLTNHFGDNIGITKDSNVNFKHSKDYRKILKHIQQVMAMETNLEGNDDNNKYIIVIIIMILFFIGTFVGLAVLYYYFYTIPKVQAFIDHIKQSESETDSDTQMDHDLNDDDDDH